MRYIDCRFLSSFSPLRFGVFYPKVAGFFFFLKKAPLFCSFKQLTNIEYISFGILNLILASLHKEGENNDGKTEITKLKQCVYKHAFVYKNMLIITDTCGRKF